MMQFVFYCSGLVRARTYFYIGLGLRLRLTCVVFTKFSLEGVVYSSSERS
jgi:hypothetical protein